MLIIGFGHRKQVGKNTAAAELTRLLSDKQVTSVAFADKLYATAYFLYAWAGFKPKDYYEAHPEEKSILLPDIGKSPRQILLDLGTKGIRNCVYNDTWVKCTLLDPPPVDILLVTDMRFPNEFNEIKRLGGMCIKIIRPSEPETDDEADIGLAEEDRWDAIVVNDGSIENLGRRVHREVMLHV